MCVCIWASLPSMCSDYSWLYAHRSVLVGLGVPYGVQSLSPALSCAREVPTCYTISYPKIIYIFLTLQAHTNILNENRNSARSFQKRGMILTKRTLLESKSKQSWASFERTILGIWKASIINSLLFLLGLTLVLYAIVNIFFYPRTLHLDF